MTAISFWVRAAGVDDKHDRARSERFAIFVGLWPPTFFLLGKVLQDIEAAPEEQVEKGRQVRGDSIEEALKVPTAA